MKDYDLIEEMNREVYKVSNSRKTLKKVKKYLRANRYNVHWDSETEFLEVCPEDKSFESDWTYTVSIGYTLGTYVISSTNCRSILIDCCGVVMLDMIHIANVAMEMVKINATIENERWAE